MSLYLKHFGLNELPFRITPAVNYFFRGTARGAILDAIKYAVENGEGILAVFGEVGNGKSMLCRRLMADWADRCELVYVANPSLSGREILYHIAEELELKVGEDRHQVARVLQQHLLKVHASGRRVIVCIDEAQAMPDESLEQIRLLSNLETGREKIVQVIMFGQPELHSKLEQPHMRQLRERITSTFNLQSFGADEVQTYIDSRLRSAGYIAATPLFAPSATAVIAKVSQGIIRRINILCDKSLLAAFASGDTRILPKHARQAARDARYQRMETHAAARAAAKPDLQASKPSAKEKSPALPPTTPRVFATRAAGVLIVLFLVLAGLQLRKDMTSSVNGAGTAQTAAAVPEAPAAAVAASTAKPAAQRQAPEKPAPAVATAAAAVQDPQPATVAITTFVQQTVVAPAEPVTVVAPIVTMTITSYVQVPAEQSEDPIAQAPAVAYAPVSEQPPAAAVAPTEKRKPFEVSDIELFDNERWHIYPAASYLRQQLNATQTAFGLLADPNLYTARILTVPRERAIDTEKYLRDLARFYAIHRVMIYPSAAGGEDNFVVTYGQYASEFEAELFIQELPSFFRNNGPYVQALSVSQLESSAHW